MKDVSIHFVQLNNKAYLQFDFTGHLTEEIASRAIKQWKTEVEKTQLANSKVDLIYNCIAMTGFDTNARRNWQVAMKELQSRTNEIWIVSDNILILGAAKTMGLLTRYTIKAVRSIKDISK